MCSAWMTHAESHASFTKWRRTKWGRRGERFCYSFCQRKRLQRDFCESCVSETEIKRNLKDLKLPKLYKRPVSIDRRNLYDNFELNWFHGLSKSPAIPFSQVSADSIRFNIQECSRSFYAFIASRPTCFARRLVMRNLHETFTPLAR